MANDEDNESCSSRTVEQPSSTHPRQHRQRLDIYEEVLQRLKDLNNQNALLPGFDDELWAHFARLPARYALDVNVESAEDVLTHKRLLQLARDPASRPALQVRVVQVISPSDAHFTDPDEDSSEFASRQSLPKPAFGSTPSLNTLAIEAEDEHSTAKSASILTKPRHEITLSTDDKPKLLSQLTALLAEIGLNIEEAHAFSTTDGYSLDVFVVNGWPCEETEELGNILQKELLIMEKKSIMEPVVSSSSSDKGKAPVDIMPIMIPTDGTDVWEIDVSQLNFEEHIASGTYGELYKGTFCSQEVAIKVLKPDRVNENMQQEFAQEVYIMRKVRHKNVVQFIGASTRPPNLCIVTEFMPGGSVYDFLHKRKGVFKLPTLLKVAIDVTKGMNYLHQNNIIHRDLKAANLLMDENGVVKVADFGVARVQIESGVMTAETGTYRWMAPEVIEHKPYDQRADIFSFAIVLWEMITGKVPYQYLTPLQAAVGVVQKNLRPIIPKNTHPKLVELLVRCWQHDPTLRPSFSEILGILQQLVEEVKEEGEGPRKEKSSSFFSTLRKGHH